MIVNLAGSLASIAADAIVVTVTWIKTSCHIKEASRLGVNVSISATLLRDGEGQC